MLTVARNFERKTLKNPKEKSPDDDSAGLFKKERRSLLGPANQECDPSINGDILQVGIQFPLLTHYGSFGVTGESIVEQNFPTQQNIFTGLEHHPSAAPDAQFVAEG